MTTLERLTEEHREHGIGPELGRLLERVVRATAPTMPAPEYSDVGVWNQEALEDALHDWVSTRLLERGDLAKIMATAATTASLRGMLTTSLRQFLINRRRRTTTTNLYRRTDAMLRSDAAFASVGTARRPSDQAWRLASARDTGLSRAPLPELVAAAAELDDAQLEVVRYGPHSLKSSPILREPKLREFLVHLLRRAEGALRIAAIAEVTRRRFGLLEPRPVELDEALSIEDAPLAATVETSELAESVLARLGFDHAEALVALERADGDAQRAAADLRRTPDEMAESINVVLAAIAEHAESRDEARQIYTLLIESLF